jgi:hypothetical protein
MIEVLLQFRHCALTPAESMSLELRIERRAPAQLAGGLDTCGYLVLSVQVIRMMNPRVTSAGDSLLGSHGRVLLQDLSIKPDACQQLGSLTGKKCVASCDRDESALQPHSEAPQPEEDAFGPVHASDHGRDPVARIFCLFFSG